MIRVKIEYKIEPNLSVKFHLMLVGQLSNATKGESRLFKVRLDNFLHKNLEEKKTRFLKLKLDYTYLKIRI